jgi:hypothetical protein
MSNNLLQLDLVRTSPDSLSRMACPPLEVILAAVETDGNAIRHVDPRWLGKGSTPAGKELEDLRLAAVRRNGFAIRHIDSPSLELRLEAVRQDPMALEFIRFKPRAVVLEAINRNPSSVRFLRSVPDWARRLIESSTGNWVEFYLAA